MGDCAQGQHCFHRTREIDPEANPWPRRFEEVCCDCGGARIMEDHTPRTRMTHGQQVPPVVDTPPPA
jgi:hypothetical protein